MKNTFVIPGSREVYYFRRVQPNDTLSQIIADYYGVDWSSMQPHIQAVMQDNPEITDPDRIRPGQLLVLRRSLLDPLGEPVNVAACEYVKSRWEYMGRPTQEAVIKTSRWYPMITTGIAATGATMFTLQYTLKSNLSMLKGIPKKYEQYKAGKVSKGQYDYFRRQQLKQYTNHIGPAIKHLIYRSQTPQQVIRIDRDSALARPTVSIQNHMNKLTNIARIASKGTFVLAGAGLAASCVQIANTENRLEKNEIAVEIITSTGVGFGLGVVAGIFLLSNPAGWTVILAIGAATAFTSVAAGKTMAHFYKSTDMKKYDLVNMVGIDKVCR